MLSNGVDLRSIKLTVVKVRVVVSSEGRSLIIF